MKHAVLFNYYKRPLACVEKLREIRLLNPDMPVYGLQGGIHPDARGISDWARHFDDHWLMPELSPFDDPRYRWRNVDQMVAVWFLARGHELEWDAVILHYWDLLVAAPLESIVGVKSPQEFVHYHYPRSLKELEKINWSWVTRHEDFPKFQEAYNARFPGKEDKICGAAGVIVTMTRAMLEEAAEAIIKLPGYLEYRLPSVAHALGYQLVQAKYPWQGPGQQCLRLTKREVEEAVILAELAKADGCRMFHPVYQSYYQYLKQWV